MIVNNTTGSGIGGGDLTLNGSNTVLGGKGIIGTLGDTASVTVTGGNLSPGDIVLDEGVATSNPSLPGVLTINGDLSLAGVGKLNSDLSNTSLYDKVVVSGNVSLEATTILNLPAVFTPSVVQSFTLIDNQGANPIGGTFSNYAEGASVFYGAQEYHLTYTGGTGNDLVLAPVVASVLGDYNNNGVVDAADYVLWRNGGPLQNEVETAGSVTPEDYTAWRARFGNTAGSGSSNLGSSSAVPEPATVLLVAIALSSVFTFRRGRGI